MNENLETIKNLSKCQKIENSGLINIQMKHTKTSRKRIPIIARIIYGDGKEILGKTIEDMGKVTDFMDKKSIFTR